MMQGTIRRWGTRGYGFIESPQLPDEEIWTHAKFLVDEDYQPRVGDVVEFEPEVLPDGRRQARWVRSLADPVAAPPRTGLVSQQASAVAPRVGTLGERFGAVLRAVRSERLSSAETPTGPLNDRIGAMRTAHAAEVARLEGRRDAVRHEIEQLEAKLRSLSEEAKRIDADIAERHQKSFSEEQEQVVAHLRAAAAKIDSGLAARVDAKSTTERLRRAAVSRIGGDAVADYEEVRRRLSATADRDRLAREAFVLLERDRRNALREYATALDQLDSAPSLAVRFFAFGGTAPAEPMTLVAPIAIQHRLVAGDPRTRIACSLWHAVERAARELAGGAPVEHGEVAGLIAVRLERCEHLDLLEVLVDETLSGRPSLEELGVEVDFERVDSIIPPWQFAPDEELVVAAAGGEPVSRALPDVAAHLGMALRDLVALLHGRGLPFPDDVIDEGTEKTLRVLLGETIDELPVVGVAPEAAPITRADGNVGLARRMLTKLLRDRRIGGRHTRIENAWGHHFSDEEKRSARIVAEWLEKEGIFIPKLNEGSHHISINPRRLPDVGEIMGGTWSRLPSLEQL